MKLKVMGAASSLTELETSPLAEELDESAKEEEPAAELDEERLSKTVQERSEADAMATKKAFFARDVLFTDILSFSWVASATKKPCKIHFFTKRGGRPASRSF